MGARNTYNSGAAPACSKVASMQPAVTAGIGMTVITTGGCVMGYTDYGCRCVCRMACGGTLRAGRQGIVTGRGFMVHYVMGAVKVGIIVVTAGGTVTGIAIAGGADGMEPGITVAVGA